MQLLTFNIPLKGVHGGEQKWDTLCLGGKTGRTGLQIDIFRSWFYEPNSCISLYLEKHWNPSWWWLFFMTSRNLLEKYVLGCMYSPFTKTLYIPASPAASVEQLLRAIWGTVSQAAVLILPQMKLNLQLPCWAFFKSTLEESASLSPALYSSPVVQFCVLPFHTFHMSFPF